MPLELLTIGHSTHPLDRFVALLAQHQIELVADIRRFPGSRRFPHFNRDSLASSLPEVNVGYLWIEALGGRRRKRDSVASVNLGLRNESFRNYADYMPTDEFRQGVGQLLQEAQRRRTAFMCSEGLFWRCHRRLVSDYLLAKDIAVRHIMPSGELRPHPLTSGVRIDQGEVTYPPHESGQSATLFG